MSAKKPNVYAIILCGGSGSRLWPRSRSGHPKHLLTLNGGRTLVQETIARAKLSPKRVFCITEASHAKILAKQVPEIPKSNIIIEPDRRGTASAIALAIAELSKVAKPDDVVVSLHADHLIKDRVEFERTMDAWVAAAASLPRIITLGIQPTYPSTGLGYINLGDRLKQTKGFDVFAIEQFVEKPNETIAKAYLKSGKYLWNAGLFAAKLKTFEHELTTHMPKLMETVRKMVESKPTVAKKLYLSLKPETIDYGVLEKSKNLAVIPASFDWADMGSWADLHDVLEHDNHDNVIEGEYVDIDTKNCFVYSPDRLVATIGVEDLVIINTKDAILICPKDRSQDVKKIVEQLKARGQTKFL